MADIPHQREDDDEATDLMLRAGKGDTAAFAALYRRYYDQVYRFIYYRGLLGRQLSEDLAADTFLRAFRRIGTWTDQGRAPGAWFVTIARNLLADHFKSGHTRYELSTGEVIDSDAEDCGPEGSPELAVIARRDNAVLWAAVAQLNADQRRCIELRFFRELSVADTARVMGKNEGAVKALQYRAMANLNRALGGGNQRVPAPRRGNRAGVR